MRLAQNTASSMGPALYASANTAIHILPPRNKSNCQRRLLKRAAIVPLRWPDCFRSSTPPKSLAWLACCVAVLTCGGDPSRDNSVVWLALGCCPCTASDQRFNIGVHGRAKAGPRQFSQCLSKLCGIACRSGNGVPRAASLPRTNYSKQLLTRLTTSFTSVMRPISEKLMNAPTSSTAADDSAPLNSEPDPEINKLAEKKIPRLVSVANPKIAL